MEEIKQVKQASLAYRLFKDMRRDDLEYTYRGTFTTSLTDNIIALAEISLEEFKEEIKVKKRVYFIMVEGLQNITRHQQLDEKTVHKHDLFVIERKKSGYFVTTGNLISNKNIENLKIHIEKINSLTPSELKLYSLEILESENVSIKGGAGLGLVEMARKSGTKLSYDFGNVDEDNSYFYLQTGVPFANADDEIIQETRSGSLAKIIELHTFLDHQNILLNYTGQFNQEKLLKLLNIIEKEITEEVVLKKKVFSVIIELLQNIVKHGDNQMSNKVDGNYGILIIREKGNSLFLNSGNYIRNERIVALKNYLDHLNLLNASALNEAYKFALVNPEAGKIPNSGMGLIDIRLKSKYPFMYEFYPIDEQFSFFSIQITVDKQETVLL